MTVIMDGNADLPVPVPVPAKVLTDPAKIKMELIGEVVDGLGPDELGGFARFAGFDIALEQTEPPGTNRIDAWNVICAREGVPELVSSQTYRVRTKSGRMIRTEERERVSQAKLWFWSVKVVR